MKEKPIETAIMQFIRYSGGWCQKVQSGAMLAGYTRKGRGATPAGFRQYKVKLADEGTPDILACIGGRFVAIEVKKDAKEIEKWQRDRETDQRSIVQHAQQDRIRQAGGITIVACSVDEVQRDFAELGLIH